MKEYDVFVPLSYNDGTPIDGLVFQTIQADLLAQFGGVTFFSQPNQGLWSLGDVTYRDNIVIYRVLANDVRKARAFMRSLKKALKRDLDQEEILIIERDVETI
jgi:hypothetical protein